MILIIVMERIKIYKNQKIPAKFFLIFGCIFTVLSISVLIKSLLDGFNFHFLGGDWIWVLFAIQGILFIFSGYSNIINQKFYIEWDDNELRFLLPDTGKQEIIKFDQIESLNIRLFEIELKLTNGNRILNLDSLQFEDLKKIKQKFESMAHKSEATPSVLLR